MKLFLEYHLAVKNQRNQSDFLIVSLIDAKSLAIKRLLMHSFVDNMDSCQERIQFVTDKSFAEQFAIIEVKKVGTGYRLCNAIQEGEILEAYAVCPGCFRIIHSGSETELQAAVARSQSETDLIEAGIVRDPSTHVLKGLYHLLSTPPAQGLLVLEGESLLAQCQWAAKALQDFELQLVEIQSRSAGARASTSILTGYLPALERAKSEAQTHKGFQLSLVSPIHDNLKAFF